MAIQCGGGDRMAVQVERHGVRDRLRRVAVTNSSGRICAFHLCALGSETTRTTGKNNFEEVRGLTRPRFFCLLHIVADGFWYTCAIATVQEIP